MRVRNQILFIIVGVATVLLLGLLVRHIDGPRIVVSAIAPDGTEIGSYTIHYADSHEEKVPLIYGRNTLEFNAGADAREPMRAPLVWSGGVVKGVLPRLFKFSWENPFPDLEVESLDFESRMTDSRPFIIAITAE